MRSEGSELPDAAIYNTLTPPYSSLRSSQTLKYEAHLGYSFQKNAEGDLIMMNDELKMLKGKEER